MISRHFLWVWPALILASCSSSKPIPQNPPPIVKGCTDSKAVNFNSYAELDDGSCRYDDVVTDYFCSIDAISSVRIGMSKTQVKNALGVYPFDILGADDGCEIHVYRARIAAQEIAAKNMHALMVNKDGERLYRGGVKEFRLFFRDGKLESILSDHSESSLPHELACLVNSMPVICASDEDYVVCTGCTDPAALNFDSGAEEDDGSCEYFTGCTDPEASNYDRSAVFDDGGCFYIGCKDENAVNYNPEARHKQSSCVYCPCDTETHYYVKSDNPRCSEPCIKMKRVAPLAEKPTCNWCDLLNGSNGAKVQIVVDGVNMNQQ